MNRRQRRRGPPKGSKQDDEVERICQSRRHGLASLVDSGEVTALELARLARDAHDEVNPQINAVIEFYDDAEAVAAAGVCGGPLHGARPS